MQTEPTITITTSRPMSSDDVAHWILVKADQIKKLKSLRSDRDDAMAAYDVKMDKINNEIAEYEDYCAIQVKTQ